MKGRKTKQVILMRTDLGMRKGKMVAQGCHASLAVFTRGLAHEGQEFTKSWLDNDFTKICLGVDSFDELENLYKTAAHSGIPSFLVTDSGKTEFGNISTVTCASIGPFWSEDIDRITGHLKLL